MMRAHRIETVLLDDGRLLLDHLPFHAGETVEVIILSVSHATTPSPTLQDTVLRYEQPTTPVAEDDWGAL
jgi:hypothetical protein